MSHFKGGMKRVFSKKEKCHCRVLMNNAATDEWKDVNSFQRLVEIKKHLHYFPLPIINFCAVM